MKKLVAPILVILCGCNTGPWIRTENPFSLPALQFSTELPAGWMRRNTKDFLLVTKDGTLLQDIVVTRGKIKEEKQFSHTKKRISAGMLPHEVAEVVADDFLSNPAVGDRKIMENAPATVAGFPAARILASFRAKSGLIYKVEKHVLLAGDSYFTITYSAPARHYFDRDHERYLRVVETFRVLKQEG